MPKRGVVVHRHTSPGRNWCKSSTPTRKMVVPALSSGFRGRGCEQAVFHGRDSSLLAHGRAPGEVFPARLLLLLCVFPLVYLRPSWVPTRWTTLAPMTLTMRPFLAPTWSRYTQIMGAVKGGRKMGRPFGLCLIIHISDPILSARCPRTTSRGPPSLRSSHLREREREGESEEERGRESARKRERGVCQRPAGAISSGPPTNIICLA